MKQRGKAFTLIELIIVVVIIAILALVAIPKYYASATKSQMNAAYANLGLIREAVLAYYAVHNSYPADGTWPVTVTIEGETIMNLSRPLNLNGQAYQYGTNPSNYGSNPLALVYYNATKCYCVRLLSGAREVALGCCAP
jgi:prepilin-type N-terminal cleavage/methylation domain-containing protein